MSKEVAVAVEVEPDTARIQWGKSVLGRGSATLTFPTADAEPRQIKLRARGYKTRTVTVTTADAPLIRVVLKRASNPGAGFLE